MTIAVDLGRKATKQTNCRRFRLQSLGQWDGGVVGSVLDWGSMCCLFETHSDRQHLKPLHVDLKPIYVCSPKMFSP